MDDGPLLALALRARRTLLAVCTALGCAAAGATVVVGGQRGAQQAYIATQGNPDTWSPICDEILLSWCSHGSWWGWPPEKSPSDSPPTAILPSRRAV